MSGDVRGKTTQKWTELLDGYDPNDDPNRSIFIGSLKISFLSGQIICKDVRYNSTDFSCSIRYLTLIFKYWVKYSGSPVSNPSAAANKSDKSNKRTHHSRVKSASSENYFLNSNSVSDPNQLSEDILENIDPRLKLIIKGYDMHIYNRSFLYNGIVQTYLSRDNQRFNTFHYKYDPEDDDSHPHNLNKSTSDENLLSSEKSDLNVTRNIKKENYKKLNEQVQYRMGGGHHNSNHFDNHSEYLSAYDGDSSGFSESSQSGRHNNPNTNSSMMNDFYKLFPVIEIDMEELRKTFGNENIEYSLVCTVKSAKRMKFMRKSRYLFYNSDHSVPDFYRYELKCDDVKDFKVCIVRDLDLESKSKILVGSSIHNSSKHRNGYTYGQNANSNSAGTNSGNYNSGNQSFYNRGTSLERGTSGYGVRSHIFRANTDVRRTLEEVAGGMSLAVDQILDNDSSVKQDKNLKHSKKRGGRTKRKHEMISSATVIDLLDCKSLGYSYFWDVQPSPAELNELRKQKRKKDKKTNFNSFRDENWNGSNLGDIQNQNRYPKWAVKITCHDLLTLNYSAYVDQQRDKLYRFFYPNDFKNARQASQINGRETFTDPDYLTVDINCNHGANINLPYKNNSREHMPKKLNIKLGDSTVLNIKVPMFDKQDNSFVTEIELNGTSPKILTDMIVPKIFSSDRMKLLVTQVHAQKWNGHQDWNIQVDFYQSTFLFFWNIKHVITDYIGDWQKYQAEKVGDIYSFIPCTYSVDINMHNYELIIPINAGNFCDLEDLESCHHSPEIYNFDENELKNSSSQAHTQASQSNFHMPRNRKKSGKNRHENAADNSHSNHLNSNSASKNKQSNKIGNDYLGLMGKDFSCNMTMPFVDFQPVKQVLEFDINLTDVKACSKLAHSDPALPISIALRENIRDSLRDIELNHKLKDENLIKNTHFNADLFFNDDNIWYRYIDFIHQTSSWTVFAISEKLNFNFVYEYDGRSLESSLDSGANKKNIRVTFDNSVLKGSTSSSNKSPPPKVQPVSKTPKERTSDHLQIYLALYRPQAIGYASAIDQCINLRHNLFGLYEGLISWSTGEGDAYIESLLKEDSDNAKLIKDVNINNLNSGLLNSRMSYKQQLALKTSELTNFILSMKVEVDDIVARVPLPLGGLGPVATCDNIMIEVESDKSTFRSQVIINPIVLKFTSPVTGNTGVTGVNSSRTSNLNAETHEFVKIGAVNIRSYGLQNNGTEYTWMMEFLIGKVKFNLAFAQIHEILQYLENLTMMFSRPEYSFIDRLKNKPGILPTNMPFQTKLNRNSGSNKGYSAVYTSRDRSKTNHEQLERTKMPDGRIARSRDFYYEKDLLNFKGIEGKIIPKSVDLFSKAASLLVEVLKRANCEKGKF